MLNFKIKPHTGKLSVSAHPLLAEAMRKLPPVDTWLPGAPPSVMPLVVETDLKIYAASGCRSCKGRRRLKTRAVHCGNRYRLLGVCGNCGHNNIF